jgi:hypothetical protein
MMTGIRFMDDMTCPRRSTVHPSQLQRRESNDGELSRRYEIDASRTVTHGAARQAKMRVTPSPIMPLP